MSKKCFQQVPRMLWIILYTQKVGGYQPQGGTVFVRALEKLGVICKRDYSKYLDMTGVAAAAAAAADDD